MINSVTREQVVVRAIKDVEFRQAILSHPKETLAKEYNVQFPDSVTIRVVEDTLATHTIVLPPQETGMLELSDMDLEAVAGGVPAPTFNGCNTKSCKINC